MNIYDNPQHTAQLSYNGFDMSQYVKFSSSVGHILPVYYDLLFPGDKITARAELKTRTMPLDSGAFASIEENIEWFFVPLPQLYQFFNEFYNGVQDFQTSFVQAPQSFHSHYPHFVLRDLIDLYNSSPDNYFEDVETFKSGMLRLLDLLGFPISKFAPIFFGGEEIETNYTFIPILLQAYQKIYYDYYRLSDREQNIPHAYNVDTLYNTNELNTAFLSQMLKLHYVPYKKDFYTNNQISPIFSALNPSSVSNYDYSAVNQWLSSTFNLDIINKDGASDQVDSTTVGMDSQTIIQGNQSLNVANIRAMFALDKLLEITRRAGKHYDKQTLAHFGVNPSRGISGECWKLHSSSSRIDIGDVIATSAGTATNGDGASANSVLGQVGGKGFGMQNGDSFSFETDCHGVLMAVYFARPVVDYYPQGVDDINTLSESVDWPKPEFDNLGMVPLFRAQTDFYPESGDSDTNGQIVDWRYRYSFIKSKPNLVHGNMAFIDSFKIWSPAKNPLTSGALANYLVNPAYLNNIMSLPFTSNTNGANLSERYNSLFGKDPLLHQIYFDVQKASKFSTFGLPSL